jgi:tRNA modification GTPase
MLDDTIAAVATPHGRGGIGIIRISGRDAVAFAQHVVRSNDARLLREANAAVVSDVFASAGPEAPIDRAVVTFFRGPHSFTGEDVVEIACHGSPIVLELLLAGLFHLGARAATPGEFSKRAFLNGKIDLVQAEGIRDLIDAQTTYQARQAQRQLRGELSRRLAPIKEQLLEVIVHLESSVEFVEDDILPDDRSSLSDELGRISGVVAGFCASYSIGKLVSDGATLALVGPVNAGKSSIFNKLLDRERAIVTPVPGTTRDLVSERLEIGGIPFRLLDTAGLRATDDVVERIGVERTLGAIADADVVLVVFDACESDDGVWQDLLDRTTSLNRLVIVNKIDLWSQPAAEISLRRGGSEAICVSALTGENFERLRRAIVASVAGTGAMERDDILVNNARHYALLRQACEQLEVARRALQEGLSEEFALSGLHSALRFLGEVTGETAIDDILHRIFSTFCIGK